MQYAKHHNNEYQVQQSLQKFEALYPYLSLIAEKTGKQAFDHDVVESYWLGNKLLEEFQDNDMKRIIEMLVQRGLPLSLGTELIKNMPHGLFPHHNFNVFYVGVGKTTGAVPTTLQNMDNCRVSWGQVAAVFSKTLIVKASPLVFTDGRFSLGKEEPKTAMHVPELLGKVKAGDIVALHWGCASLILDDGQVDNLKKYTLRLFDALAHEKA